MTLRFAGTREKEGKKTVYSLACETCQDPENVRLHKLREDSLPLIILYVANRVYNRKEITRLASWHESLFGKDGKKHRLVARGSRLSEAVRSQKFTEEWLGVTISAEELALGHPGYQKQQQARARLCPIKK